MSVGINCKFRLSTAGDFLLSGINVGSPLECTEAAVGDVLLKVNGNSVSGFSLVQLRDALLGSPGSKLTLDFLRLLADGSSQRIACSCTRSDPCMQGLPQTLEDADAAIEAVNKAIELERQHLAAELALKRSTDAALSAAAAELDEARQQLAVQVEQLRRTCAELKAIDQDVVDNANENIAKVAEMEKQLYRADQRRLHVEGQVKNMRKKEAACFSVT